MQLPGHITTIQELANYLHDCIALDGKESRPDIASRIVGLVVNDSWNEWCHSRRYPELKELYEIASDIEAWPVYGLRDSDWRRLEYLVVAFRKRVGGVQEQE